MFPKLMGIVNVTPDSFSDGGRFLSFESATKRIDELIEQGVDILDLGAESTRPGFTAVGEACETDRLRLALPYAVSKGIPVSVDTMKANVARYAVEQGAQIINDVRGLQGDKEMAPAVASAAKIVAMHWTQEGEVSWEGFKRYFEVSLEIGARAGIASDRFILDPGLGFDKSARENIAALRLVPRLKDYFKLPVLVGASRKRFTSLDNRRAPTERVATSLAVGAFAAELGADILRVHDVREHADFFEMKKRLGSC